MQSNTILTSFLSARSLTEPDGRPIYAYRVTPAESTALAECLSADLASESMPYAPSTSTVFCIWAADFWRRRYTGGHPSWSMILGELQARHLEPPEPGYRELQRMVREGMGLLGRQVLRLRASTEYLTTLICEGGLPLRLVQREQGVLRTYFRALLREGAAYRVQGQFVAGVRLADTARRLGEQLPASLRQLVVYELSGQLAESVLALTELAGDGDNVIQRLDRMRPVWRSELPLDLPDEVAREFVTFLVREAGAARATGPREFPLRWVRSLVRTGSEPEGPPDAQRPAAQQSFRLRGQLSLALQSSRQAFERLFPGLSLPLRFALTLGGPRGSVVVASGAVRLGGNGASVRLDHTRAAGHIDFDRDALEGRALVLRTASGQLHTSSGFPGSAPLSDLPWVFAPPDGDSRQLQFAGEGSTTVRTATAVVVVPDSVAIVADGESTVTRVGQLVLGLETRGVYEVSGTAVCGDEATGRSRVRTAGTDADAALEHRLIGPEMLNGRGQPIGWRGQPTLYEWRSDDRALRVPPHELYWKSVIPNAKWRPLDGDAIGEGTLRRSRDGYLLFQAPASILPSGLALRLSPESPHHGTCQLSGTAGAVVEGMSRNGLKVRVTGADNDTVQLAVESYGHVAPTFQATLVWPHRGRATIPLAVPVEQGSFLDRRYLTSLDEARIAVSQLPYAHASVVVASRKRHVWLEGALTSGQATSVRRDAAPADLWVYLRKQEEGVYGLDLDAIRGEVEDCLLASDALDDEVTLSLRTAPQLAGAAHRLRIGRYDLALDPGSSHPLWLGADDVKRLRDDELERLEFRTFPLVRPLDQPVVLNRVGLNAWEMPEDARDGGPWLVSGWDGDWCRVRPRIVTVRGPESPMAPGSLQAAILADPATRHTLLGAAVERLADDPDEDGWALVDGYLSWIPDFPPSTFDVLRFLPRSPRTMAMSAFRAAEVGRDALDRLLQCLRELPFSWHALSHGSWRESGERWLKARLQQQREFAANGAVEAVRDQCFVPVMRRLLDAPMPWLRPILEELGTQWLEMAPGTELPSTGLDEWISAEGDALFDRMVQLNVVPEPGDDVPKLEQLYRRRAALEPYFVAHRLGIGQVKQFSHPRNLHLVNAPLIAAACAAHGIELSQGEQLELRRAQRHRAEWFDEVYEAASRLSYAIVAWGRSPLRQEGTA